MADVQEKHESKNVPYEEIFADIDLESLLKSTVFLQCHQTKRVWREERACSKKPLGKCMQLFDKKKKSRECKKIISLNCTRSCLDSSSICKVEGHWQDHRCSHTDREREHH